MRGSFALMMADTTAVPSDAGLVSAIASGDESAMGQLYDRYSAVVYSIALRVLGDRLFIWKPPLRGWVCEARRSSKSPTARKRLGRRSTGTSWFAKPVSSTYVRSRAVPANPPLYERNCWAVSGRKPPWEVRGSKRR